MLHCVELFNVAKCFLLLSALTYARILLLICIIIHLKICKENGKLADFGLTTNTGAADLSVTTIDHFPGECSVRKGGGEGLR